MPLMVLTLLESMFSSSDAHISGSRLSAFYVYYRRYGRIMISISCHIMEYDSNIYCAWWDVLIEKVDKLFLRGKIENILGIMIYIYIF
jgi:hypothetical protein